MFCKYSPKNHFYNHSLKIILGDKKDYFCHYACSK